MAERKLLLKCTMCGVEAAWAIVRMRGEPALEDLEGGAESSLGTQQVQRVEQRGFRFGLPRGRGIARRLHDNAAVRLGGFGGAAAHLAAGDRPEGAHGGSGEGGEPDAEEDAVAA